MFRTISLCVALGTVCAWGQPAIPETPAGRVLRAFLDAFNSGDRARIEDYVRKHEPQGSAERHMQMYKQTGGLELTAIDEASQPTIITFLVKERSGDAIARGKLLVKDSDPPVVVSMPVRLIPKGQAPPNDIRLDAATRSSVIDAAVARLNANYVFPELARKMEDNVRAHHKRGDYDSITDGDAFAATLTDHFRDISKDKHLRVNYSPTAIPEQRPGRSPEAIKNYRTQMERENCGFERAERMPQNIGYLKFNFFADADVCGPTAIAAMNFLGNVDALIVDLRDNGGGQPAMIALITSYLFTEPTHLNDLYDRSRNTTTQYWTLPFVPGRRLGDKPVYVLTSSRTFSGAEEFSYNLKNLKRATIIGETTGGGAHPVSGHRIHEHFSIGVPFARAINPISKTNWEGTGVEPDIQAPREEALPVALKLAREKLREMKPSN